MGIFSGIISFFRSMRGARYAFRLLTGKRMGFSLRGPAGMRFHYNSDGSLRSLSLKTCAGMRVVVGSNGKFKGLSIPGLLKGTRVFTNASGELTGFGLPRLFGGFLLFDAHGKLKGSYGPIANGACLSRDEHGNRKRHVVSDEKKDSFIENEAREHIPGTKKSYTRRGEVTEKGIVPIKESDLDKFVVKREKSEGRTERNIKRNPERTVERQAYSGQPIQMNLSDIHIDKDTGGKISEEAVLDKPNVTRLIEQPVKEVIRDTAEPVGSAKPKKGNRYNEIKRPDADLKKQMDETYKELDEIAEGREEVPFDELF